MTLGGHFLAFRGPFLRVFLYPRPRRVDTDRVTSDDHVLSVTCPACGASFASSIQVDRETFDKMRLDDVLERCSACHEASRFDKSAYSFRPA